jgi:hypothetical protein
VDSFHRYYLAQEIHPVDDEVLAKALESLEGVALKFSLDAISDAEQRANYNRNVQRVKAAMLAEVRAGRVRVKEAAEHCYALRNQIMIETRNRTSVQGKAVAEHRKNVSPALRMLLEKYSGKRFGKSFAELNSHQRNAIHYEIIESSARPSAKYNTTSKVLNVTGKVLIVVTIAYAVYDVVNADNKIKEVTKQGAMISGSFAGARAGAAVSVVCGPGAPICTIALMLAGGLVGGLAGGWSASQIVELMDGEIEEFIKWQVF